MPRTPKPTTVQLEVLRHARFSMPDYSGQAWWRVGCTVHRVQPNTLNALKRRGWVYKRNGDWWLTDSGLTALEKAEKEKG